MKFRDMSTEMTEQEIITALYMICPDSLYKRYKREKDINIVLNVKNATTNDSSEVWEEDNSDLDDWGKDLYTPSH